MQLLFQGFDKPYIRAFSVLMVSYLGLFKGMFESDVCISGFSAVFPLPGALPVLVSCWDDDLLLRFCLCGVSFLGAFSVRGPLECALHQRIPWVAFSRPLGSAACLALDLLAESTQQKPEVLGATHSWDRISADVQP